MIMRSGKQLPPFNLKQIQSSTPDVTESQMSKEQTAAHTNKVNSEKVSLIVFDQPNKINPVGLDEHNEEQEQEKIDTDTADQMMTMMKNMMSMVQEQNKQISELKSSMTALKDRQDKQEREELSNPTVKISKSSQNNTVGLINVRKNLLNDLNATEPQSRFGYENNSKIYDLPPFAGEPELWPGFYSYYEETTEAYNYSNLQNMFRLQKSLSGAAKEAVGGMMIYPDNVPNVIKELEFRFGRPEILVNDQLSKLKRINHIIDENIPALISYSTKVKNMTALFIAANLEHYLINPTLLEELVSKLSMAKKMDWARYRTELGKHPTVADFNDWLNETARLASLIDFNPGAIPKRNSSKPFVGAVSQGPDGQKTFSCHLCQKEHNLQDCESVINMTLAQKMECLRKGSLCFICLKRGHLARDCKQRKVCLVNDCERFHHKLLHDNSAKGKSLLAIQHNDPESTTTLFKVIPIRLIN